MQAPNLGDKSKEIIWETNAKKCCMASGKGRTAVQAPNSGEKSKRITWETKNRN